MFISDLPDALGDLDHEEMFELSVTIENLPRRARA